MESPVRKPSVWVSVWFAFSTVIVLWGELYSLNSAQTGERDAQDGGAFLRLR